MKSRIFSKPLAIFFTVLLIVPSVFFATPQRAHAIPVVDAGNLVQNTITAIQTTISAVSSVTSDAALIALQINAYVLQPLAFVLSGNLLKAMTAGTIAFIIGKANGTGVPQFVADIQTSLQTVSDNHTLAFFDQYVRNSQSPYAGSIVAALSKEYLNKTSLAGFWAQNMDTLRRTSPNIYGYLNGNWRLGGVSAWFALTTRIQNNPYSAYAAAQSQLAGLVGAGAGGATGARLADLSNGQGFVSWCGSSDGFLGSLTTGNGSGANAAAVDQAGRAAYQLAYDKAKNAGDSDEEAQTLASIAESNAKTAAFNQAKAANAGNSFLGVAPGDPCTNADGTTGTIKTPGSVIVAGLNKVLGGQQDNVVRMGNVGPQINQILANIGQVLQTVQFASKILGGPGSGGLFGVDQPSPGQTRSALNAYANSSGNLGATNSGVLTNAATQSFSGSAMLDRVTKYETAINAIQGPANTTSSKVTALINFCTAQQQIATNTLTNGSSQDQANLASFMSASTVQLNAAQNALATVIAPAVSKTDAAVISIANARAMVQKIQSELNSGTPTVTDDIQTLQTMPPSVTDLATAQADGQTSPDIPVVASPPGSLSVSGGTLIDQLKLIGTNADTLYPVCTAPTPVAPVAIPTP